MERAALFLRAGGGGRGGRGEESWVGAARSDHRDSYSHLNVAIANPLRQQVFDGLQPTHV